VVGGAGGPGFDSVAGFATNVNSYVATVETFLPDPDLVVGGIVLYEGSSFFDWSRHLDVTDHVEPVRNGLIAAGFPPEIGALVDTGQNGWGGPERPTAVSTSFDVDTYVAESRLDRRPHRPAACASTRPPCWAGRSGRPGEWRYAVPRR
jgi:cellulose 1,4-beta-cellobiosidase